MPHNEKCFTFIWKIKNFDFCFSKESIIKSPLFFVHVMGGTKWYLCLRPNSSGFKSCIACGIVAQDSKSAPHQFEFDYELSFLASNGTVQHSELFLKKVYKCGYEDWSAALYVKTDEVFLPKTDILIPDDFLTIRCRIWDSKYSIPLSGRCFAKTLFQTQCRLVEGRIGDFSQLEPKGKYPVFVHSPSRNAFFSSLNLCVAADGKLAIEMEQKSVIMYRYEVCIRDSSESKVKCGQGNVYDSKIHCVPLTFTKEHLIRNKRYYLSSDVLRIECRATLPTGEATEKIGETEYGFEYQDTLDLESKARSSIVFSEKQYIENITTLKDDLTSLFREGVLCDTKLKTATETFPAHTVVLSARSPVFKSMFTADMKEKTNNCVEIDDLDAETVRRMLLFIYSANLDELEFESAKNLYFAADKYNIVSLFQRCSSFLKQNLLESNCCDILLLADNHQDKDLKSAVQEYIAKNDEAVLLSEEWTNLERNHPQLTIEALRTVCMKNRRV
ncbi:unnamed protein product [Larinioides sclopetarius]|uniref:BTB domain-containing protein n=1 Tax=Larinioides sclopetarius TaxID=280406 RepID=A0AAV2BJB7_9ARAC